MSHEMLPADIFTRPRGRQATIYVKKYLTDENEIAPELIRELGTKIAKTLRATTLFTDEEIIDNFEHVDDLEEFNSILDDMYDECDRVRILVK